MNHPHPFELTDPVHNADHVSGAQHASITIVEYGDFECPNCKQAAPALKMLLARHVGRICLVFRHFPLEDVHPHALAAAEAAECAGGQGKFWEMHDLLFDHQTQLKPKQLLGYAEQLELDIVRFTTEMEDHIYLQRIREQIESGRRSGVRSTPGIFVNGKIQDVSFGLHTLVDATDAALKGG